MLIPKRNSYNGDVKKHPEQQMSKHYRQSADKKPYNIHNQRNTSGRGVAMHHLFSERPQCHFSELQWLQSERNADNRHHQSHTGKHIFNGDKNAAKDYPYYISECFHFNTNNLFRINFHKSIKNSELSRQFLYSFLQLIIFRDADIKKSLFLGIVSAFFKHYLCDHLLNSLLRHKNLELFAWAFIFWTIGERCSFLRQIYSINHIINYINIWTY